MIASCHHCSKRMNPGRLIRLWDDKLYCAHCIESASPILLRFVLEHDELREELPFQVRNEVRAQIVLSSKLILVLGLLLAAPACVLGDAKDVASAVLVASVLVLLALLIQAPLFLHLAKSTRPVIVVRNGLVTARRPSSTRRAKSFMVPLTCCAWYEGKVKHDTFYRGLQMRGNDAIILVYSIRWCRWNLFQYKIACGFTPELREVWRAFVGLIELPRYQRPLLRFAPRRVRSS